MKLKLNRKPNRCVAGALAMVLNVDVETIESELFHDLPKPFPPPWDHLEKVPSTDEIADYCWSQFGVACIPFHRDPHCRVHENCPPIPVYERGDEVFWSQLNYGSGLIEGTIGDISHMVAWGDGLVFDPRGYTYFIEECEDHDFEPHTFWLTV